MEEFKLDLKDKKLLTLLDENCRYTNTQLAKKVGLSKPAVEYRLNRFRQNNIIFSYYAVVDFTKLGYSQYKVYFKFQNTNLENEKSITHYWINNNNSVWVAQVRGRWDLAVSILAKSNFDFGKILSNFMNKYAEFVLEKDVLLTEYSPVYAREYLTETKPSEFVYGNPDKISELDEIDHIILRELSNNARINIVDLAQKTRLTRDIINYRLKKLTNEGIIVQYRCYPNLEPIGINLYKLIIRTKNFDESAEKQLKEYVKTHKKATQFLKLIGSWDLEIEFETESEDELYKIINEFRRQFSDITRDYDILRITKTQKYDFYPF